MNIRVQVDGFAITDKVSFHRVFAAVMGFPEFYGNNMDAWIDCMEDLRTPENGMTRFALGHASLLEIELLNCEAFREAAGELFGSLLDCIACVNANEVERGRIASIALIPR